MTRLHHIAVLLLVASALAASPWVADPAPRQDLQVIIAKSVRIEAKADDKAKDKNKDKEKEQLSAEEKKKKIAESLKKAIDPKKAAALAEKLEREKKEKKQAAVNEAEKVKKDAEAAELKALLPQFEQQVRPLIRSKYNLLRSVANPTKEQRAKIVVEAEEAQRDVVKVFAELQLKMQRGMWDGNSKYPNGQNLVAEKFKELAKKCLNPDQLERYNQEMARREEVYKSVCVKNLVSMIDQQLVLSPDQRDKLAADLAKKWDKNWVSSLEVFMYGEQFMPQLPDDVMLTHLNASQKEVWKATPRNGGNIWGGFGFMWGNNFDAGPLDKDFPKEETPKAVEKPKDAPAKAEEKPKEAPAKVEEKPAEPAKAEEKPKDPAPKTEEKPKS